VAGGAVAIAAAIVAGVRHPLGLAVAAAVAVTVFSLAAALVLEVRQQQPLSAWPGLRRVLARYRRQYAGFIVHLAFVCLAVGVTGSSLGAQRYEATLAEGETINWADRNVRFVRWTEQRLPDQVVVGTELEIRDEHAKPFRLLPARHFRTLQRIWTTQVAIHADWAGDFYAILHDNNGQGRAGFTLLVNPLMRWMWLSGGVALLGTLLALWPARRPVYNT
jgi:cytochrome c-type biogenesis protein CcmF